MELAFGMGDVPGSSLSATAHTRLVFFCSGCLSVGASGEARYGDFAFLSLGFLFMHARVRRATRAVSGFVGLVLLGIHHRLGWNSSSGRWRFGCNEHFFSFRSLANTPLGAVCTVC